MHRYSFDGRGTEVVDSVGRGNGAVVNTTLSGSGSVTLAGGTSKQYVRLPSGLTRLSSVSVEVWVTWAGGEPWQRVFDFGENAVAEETKTVGRSYLLLTPSTVETPGTLRAAAKSANGFQVYVSGGATLPVGVMSHVTVVVDGSNGTLSLYRGAVLEGSANNMDLNSINDANAWLGRSQFSNDPYFAGNFQEVRIYDTALTQAQIRALDAAGPNAAL